MIDYDAKRWIDVIARIRGTVLPRIIGRVAFVAALGGVAVFMNERYHDALPATAHTLVGVALGLLLVFRTNASYDRYWEGRRLFGAMINRSRDLARQVAAHVEGDDAATRADRDAIGRWIVLAYALVRQQLRAENDLVAIGDLATEAELRVLEAVAVRPLIAYQWISARIATIAHANRVSPMMAQAMDANVTSLIDALGGMERIQKTPVPLAYAHHIKMFLTLFCFTVPFAIVDAMKAFTPVAAAIVAYGLFGIDEIGIEIEDPFGRDPNDLALEQFGRVIERDTSTILSLGAHPVVAASPSDGATTAQKSEHGDARHGDVEPDR